ncbi:MAG: PTS sugar transporter subunit IIA [Elusimicrobiota bacterium]|jgi:PTS system nitrogen regulatory IIA component
MQLSVKDAARLLEVPEKVVYRWIEEGRLPANRVNEQYLFNRAELLEWATAQKVRVSPDIYREVDGSLLSLCDALSAGGVHAAVDVPDKAEAFKSVIAAMPLPEEADREALLEILLAREALCTTGVGGGIALPHARNPLVLPMDKPMAAIRYLDPAVDFSAHDGRPVHAVFLIISTGIREHLHLLSRLAYILSDKACKALLERRAAQAELLAAIRTVEGALTSRRAG